MKEIIDYSGGTQTFLFCRIPLVYFPEFESAQPHNSGPNLKRNNIITHTPFNDHRSAALRNAAYFLRGIEVGMIYSINTFFIPFSNTPK